MTGAFCACVLTGACLLAGQSSSNPYGDNSKEIYSNMLDAVRKIEIFDDHGHPGFPEDANVDAMVAPPGSTPLRLRADNPELATAAHALFGYPFGDFTSEHASWLIKRKAELKSREKTDYFNHILDRTGIERAVANRVSMPEYLDSKRFAWVFFVDSFLFPFDNSALRAVNPDQAVYLPLQETKLRREVTAAKLDRLPDSLESYLRFVSGMLERNIQAGGVGMKFEVAYFRSLHFEDPSRSEAETVYARYSSGGIPKGGEYIRFQDFIFRFLLREAGRLKIPVQIHTSVGVGDYFNVSAGNLMNLENVLRDPRYDSVRFVLLHGGYPFDREAIWLTARKNVFLDSSLIELMLYPSQFREILKRWLTVFPEKVVFGSDAFPFNEALGAEEAYWLATESARKSLAAALAELIAEHALSKTEALTIAHGYLHDNAARLYGRLEAR